MKALGFLLLGSLALAAPGYNQPPAKFALGVPPLVRRGMTLSGGSVTVQRTTVAVLPDQSQEIVLVYQRGSDGKEITMRRIIIDPTCSTSVMDERSIKIADAPPASLCAAAANYRKELDSFLGTVAKSGSINLY